MTVVVHLALEAALCLEVLWLSSGTAKVRLRRCVSSA